MAFAGAMSAQDFTISANPTSFGTVAPGQVLTSTITTTVSGGFNFGVSLSNSPVPYATFKFTPGTIPRPGAGTSTLTITLGSGIGAGNYTVTITGSGGPTSNPISHTTQITFTVPGVAYTVNGRLGPVLSGSDPLGFGKGTNFVGTLGINPADVSSNPGNTASYSNLGVTIASALTLDCTGASATVVVDDNTVGGDDTFSLGNCTLSGVAPFTVRLAMPSSAFPSPIPLPFSLQNLDDTNAGTTSQYTQGSYTYNGSTTTLGISGTISASCVACSSIASNPGSLTFNATSGGGSPQPQNIMITTTGKQTSVDVQTSVTSPSGGNWLSVSPNFIQTGNNIAVSVTPGSLGPGTYTGKVILYAGASGSPLTVNVTLNVGAAAFTISSTPPSFSFSAVTGANTPTQTIAVSASDSSQDAYTLSTSTTDGNQWLTVNPTSGTTGNGSQIVSVDQTKVPTGGSYTGQITVTASGATNSPLKVPVTFSVIKVAPSPTSLTFNTSQGGANPNPQQLNVTSTGPSTVGYTATASSSGWLSVTPGSGTTNGSALSVSVNNSLFTNSGTFTGSINITPTGATTAIVVPVSVIVSSSPSIQPSPGTLTFTSANGAVPNSQMINLTASSGSINYNVAASTVSGGAWLKVSPSSGSTPGSTTVSIDPTVLPGLAVGSYTGSVTYTATSPAGAIGATVQVTLVVSATLSPTPTSLTFNYTLNGSVPGGQPIMVNSTGGAISYTATASSTGGAWLTVAPGSGTTPSSVTASLAAGVVTTLQAGQYTGNIALASAGNSTVNVPVTLNVVSQPTLSVTGGPLSFSMVNLGALPQAQNLSVSASGGASINYTVAAATSTGGSWLAAGPNGTTPGTVSVSILKNSLGAGTYNGTVTVTASGASNSPQVVNVTLTVSAAPALSSSSPSLTFAYQINGNEPPSQNLNITSSGPDVSFTATAAVTTPPSGTWLAVSPGSGNTPGSVSVTVTAAGLSAGTYNGTVTIASTQTNPGSIVIPVTLTVSALPSITTSPSSLSFAYTTGGTVPGAQPVTIGSTGSALTITSSTSTPWLSIQQTGTTTPGVSLSVSLISAQVTSLTPGTYNGSISITAPGAANTPLTYQVTLVVSAPPNLTASPSPLSFSYMFGGTPPGSQTLHIGSSGAALSYTAAATTTSNGSWLSVTPTSGSTPGTVTVSVATAGLSVGVYTGSINLTSANAGNSPLSVPVTLTITAGNPVVASPNSLTFSYTLGGTAPTSQPVSLTSGLSVLAFTATPSTTTGGSWLSVNPTSGNTPTSLSVSVVPGSLAAGTYTGAVTVAATGSNTVTIPVTFTIVSQPGIQANPTSLTFNYVSGSIAPPAQSVAVSTANNASANFAAVAATTSGGNWLAVSASSHGAQGTVLAMLNTAVATTLAAGTYNGTITVSATGFTSTTVNVSLVVTIPKATIQISGNTSFVLANTAAPATSNLSVTSSDGSSLAYTVTSVSGAASWLKFSTTGTTPGTLALTVNPAGLTPGTYESALQVAFTSTSEGSKQVVVTLTITGSNLSVGPSSLTFTYQPGAPTPPAQTLTVSPANGMGTVTLQSVVANVPWLTVTHLTVAPGTVQVGLNPGLLTPGIHEGAVVFTGLGSPGTSLTVPVTVTVNATPSLTVTPSSLTFAYQIGGSAPAPQSIALSTGGVALNFAVTSPGPWLVLNPAKGTTPGSVLVTVNPAGLPAGTYSGNLTATAYGSSNQVNIPVSLIITGGGTLQVSPSQLTLTSAASQGTLSVTATGGGALTFTAAAASTGWLSVSPANGTTPASLTVSANLSGLAAGTYAGTVTIAGSGGTGSLTVNVTLNVSGSGTPVISGIINAASGAVGTVSPGMAVSVFGTNLGPATGVGFTAPASGGSVATALGGTQVLFDGTPSPLLYSQSGQVNALAPFELQGKSSTVVTVTFNNGTSTGMTMQVAPASPGLFAANGSGTGQGAILNQDGSVNSDSNPAAQGSVIVLYGTGGGVTNPATTDGQINPDTSTGALVTTPVSATVGGQPATVDYSGPAPGLVAGIIQINVTLPSNIGSGDIPVGIQIGTAASQQVTVAVSSGAKK